MKEWQSQAHMGKCRVAMVPEFRKKAIYGELRPHGGFDEQTVR